MDLNGFLNLLHGVTCTGGQYKAKCPAHDDKKPSLSVAEGEDGKILLNCHAGCSIDEICSALGLALKDLFLEPPNTARKPPIIATYDYTDENGKLLCQKQRRADKSFIWRRPDGCGGWKYDRKGVKPTLYNVAEAVKSNSVYLVEGEKDVDTLKRLGKVAVSPPDGAGSKWKKEYTAALKGRDVAIIADNDEPGWKFAVEAGNQLYNAAKSVRILDLKEIWPDIPEHGDTTDLIEHFGDDDGIGMIQELARNAEAFTLESQRKIITLNAVEVQKSDWLWYPYIPLGKITLLSADPGTGKTFLCLYLAAKTSTGGMFFGDTTERAPANVLYQTAEDGIADTIKPRLVPMNPDFSRIGLIDEREQGLCLSDKRIEDTMRDFKPKLMIFDPLQAYLGADVDMHRANEVRPILAQISRLAEEYKCAVILVMHMSKMSQSKALYRGLGSIDIPAVARSMLIIGKNPENHERRILCHEKSSLAMHGESIEFSINPEHGGVVFHGFSPFSADDILNVKKGERDKPSVTLDEAVLALGELMGDDQAAKLDDIKELQKKYGFSKGTLYNAKDELGLKSVQMGFCPKTTWWLGPDVDVEQFRRAHTEGVQTGL